MHGRAIREQAIRLHADGLPILHISRLTGVSRAAIRDWVSDPAVALNLARRRRSECFRCVEAPCPCPDRYAYLLGQYLGDGHLVTSTRVPRLRIACADAYPGIAGEVDAALEKVSGNRPGSFQRIGCSDHQSYWMHWPCVFPQHGPGRKHLRPIVLAPWQQEIVDAHPWPLIRGLIHSDGCRAINRVVVRGKAYSYPRYLFANESTDILSIMGDALDRVGAEWRYNRPNSISIARRASVALLDVHVGRKT